MIYSIAKKKKHLFLTKKGLEFTRYDYTYEICDANITHDIIVGTVLRKLLKFDFFHNGKMFHQINFEKILPDAEIYGGKKGNFIKMAIEVELTQKDQDRVKSKYIQYGREHYFNYCLFITNKAPLYKTYKKYLESMNLNIQKKIILLWDNELSTINFMPQDLECFYMGKTMPFKDLIYE